MSGYKNSIQLEVQIDSKKQAEANLQKVIENLNKNKINLDVEFKGDAYKNLQNLSTLIDSINSKTGQGITLGDFNKSIKDSLNDISKLSNEITKVSRTNVSDGLFKQVENFTNGIGQTSKVTSVVQQMGDEFKKVGSEVITTTNDVEKYRESLLKIEQAQESLSKMKMVDSDKVADLKNILSNKEYISSNNELNNYLQQVKELETEEKSLLNLKQKEVELNNKLNNSEYTSSQKQAYSELSNLQKEEYSLKEKLISAEGEYKQKLEERLIEINLLKNAQKQDINNNNLTNIQKENDLIKQQEQLQEQLNQTKAKNNDSISNSIQKEVVAYQREQQAVQDLIQKQIKLLEIKKQGVIAKDNKADTSAIDDAISKYKQLNNISMKDLRNEISYINAEMKTSSANAETFMGKIGKNLASIGFYVDLGDMIRGTFNAFEDGVGHVIKLEDSLTDLKRVYTITDAEAKNLTNTISNQALELGTSTETLMDLTTQWLKLGYSLRDAQNMANSTQKFTFSADLTSTTKSAEALVAILKGLNLEASQIDYVGDSINGVSNSWAITSQQINDALLRSSSALGAFGNGLEQSISMATILTEVTQDASKAGNSLASIASRLTSNKNAIDSIEEVGIKLEKENGTLKSTYELVQELGKAYSGMSNNAGTAKWLSNLFGRTQIQSGAILLQNYEKLDDVITTIGESGNSVQQEFDMRMNSTTGKIEQLKQTINQLWENSINSNVTKTFVSGLTNVLGAFNNLPSAIGMATTALLMFKGQAIMGAIQSMGILIAGENAMTLATTGASLAWEKLSLAMSSNPLGAIALILTGTVLLINKLKKAQDNLIASNKEVIESYESEKSSITSANKLFEEKKKLEEQLSKTNEGTKENKELKEKLLEIEKQLAQALPNSVSGYDAQGVAISQNNKLIQAQIDLKNKQLEQESLKQLKSNTTLFDDDIKSFKNMQETLESYKKSREELLEKKSNADASGNKLISMTTQNAINDYNKEISAMETSVSQRRVLILQLLESGKTYKEIANSIGESESSVKSYTSSLDDNTTTANTNKTSQDSLSDTVTKAGLSAEDAEDQFKLLSDTFNGMSSQVGIIDQVVKELKEYKGITEDTYGKLIQSHPEVLATLVKEGDTISNLTKLRDKDKQQMESAKESAVQLANEQYNTVLSNNQGEMQSNEEKNTNKVNSDSEANSQIQDNNADTVDKNGENYVKDGKNFDEITQSKITSDGGVGTAMTTNMSNTVNALSDLYLKDYINFETQTRSKMNLLDQLKSQLGSSASELIQNANTLDDVVGIRMADKMSLPTNDEITTDVGKSFGVQLKAYGEAFKKASDSIKTELKSELPEMIKAEPTMIANPTSGSKGSGSKGKSSADKAKKDAEKEAEKALKEAVERDKEKLKKLTDAYDDAKNSITDNLKDIELNEQLLGKADNSNYVARVKLANDRIVEQSKALDSANQQLMSLENTTMETSEGQQSLSENLKKATTEIKNQKLEVIKLQQTLQELATDQIQQLLKKEKELKDLELNANQNKQTEDLKKYTDAQENAHNSRLDNLNEEMDALEKQKDIEDQEVKIAELKADIEEKKADLIEKQNTLKQKQIDLERAQNQKTIYEYTKQEDGSYEFQWVANKDTIKSAKDNVDSAQKDVDSAKDSIKDSKDALSDYYDELEYNANKKAIQDKIDEENAKYKITQDFLSKKSEALSKQQETEKKQLEYHYADIEKLSKDYLAELNQQYGDNWEQIATTIDTNLTTIETRFNKLNDLNVNYGLDSVAEAMNSSNLDSYIIKRKQSIQGEVDVTTEALNQQLSSLISYSDEMEKKKTESSTNMLNTQKDYSDDSTKLQNDTNATKLLNELTYLQSQNQLTEGMLNTLHLIYDEAWGDIVDVTTLSVEEMLKQLQVMKGIHDKFVAMWNDIHKEDEWKDNVSISSNMSEWNAYKNGQKDYISAKELLYGIGSNSLSQVGKLDTSGLSSISLGNNGLNALMPSTTNNSNSSVNNYYNISDVSVNANDANKFLSSVINLTKQNAKTSK